MAKKSEAPRRQHVVAKRRANNRREGPKSTSGLKKMPRAGSEGRHKR
jgi:hypothetical protein